jgi:hypothetical protein
MSQRRRKQPRVGRWLRPCPDCAAEVDDTYPYLQHEPTCPLMNGVDAITDGDRRWFLDNPGESVRTRRITAAEMASLNHLDAVTDDDRPTHVHVYPTPWGRIRQYCNHDEEAS